MAYADKSSDMRRMVISKGGHVIWEGVKIDDTCLLTCRERDSIWNTEYKELVDYYWQENENLKGSHSNYIEEPYMILFKDTEDNQHWNVKEQYTKEVYGKDSQTNEETKK